jgi:hypothetical protein
MPGVKKRFPSRLLPSTARRKFDIEQELIAEATLHLTNAPLSVYRAEEQDCCSEIVRLPTADIGGNRRTASMMRRHGANTHDDCR